MTPQFPGSIGWLGTGRMGAAMAGRLIDAGRPGTVWTRTGAKTQPLAERGASVGDSLGGLASCDLVFVMVSSSADLEQVTLGAGGLLTGERRPGILVDCSTVSEEVSSRIRAAAAAAGTGFLAAPVSGNPEVFAAGQGTCIVSGPVDTFHVVRPDLERIAKAAVHVGAEEQQAGQTVPQPLPRHDGGGAGRGGHPGREGRRQPRGLPG